MNHREPSPLSLGVAHLETPPSEWKKEKENTVAVLDAHAGISLQRPTYLSGWSPIL